MYNRTTSIFKHYIIFVNKNLGWPTNRQVHGYGTVVIHFNLIKEHYRFYSFKSIAASVVLVHLNNLSNIINSIMYKCF